MALKYYHGGDENTMTCPICGEKSKVTDTGTYIDCIFRKRICLLCKKVFYTLETDFPDAKYAAKRIYELKKGKTNDKD